MRGYIPARLPPYPEPELEERDTFGVEPSGFEPVTSAMQRMIALKKRADERTRSAFLISLRVMIQALQGFAEVCKFPISRRFSILCLALCRTVLRPGGISVVSI